MFKSISFDKEVSLFGDSKLINEGSSIQLTNSVSGSEGRVLYKEPINLFQGDSLSFSSYFSFSMPNETDDFMGFVMVPTSFDLSLFSKNSSSSALGFLCQYAKKETAVAFEFVISERGNHARVLIGKPESSEIRNLSFEHDLFMEYGGPLSCMIHYEASLKRMRVRFRKLSTRGKMVDPFFDIFVDLGEIWNGGEFLVGLSSINGNSSKAHVLHSWEFSIRDPMPLFVPPSMYLHPPPSSMKIEGSRCEIGPLGQMLVVPENIDVVDDVEEGKN